MIVFCYLKYRFVWNQMAPQTKLNWKWERSKISAFRKRSIRFVDRWLSDALRAWKIYKPDFTTIALLYDKKFLTARWRFQQCLKLVTRAKHHHRAIISSSISIKCFHKQADHVLLLGSIKTTLWQIRNHFCFECHGNSWRERIFVEK